MRLDGDSRLRRLFQLVHHHDGSKAQGYIKLDHPLVQISLPNMLVAEAQHFRPALFLYALVAFS